MTDYKALVRDLRHRSDVQRKQYYVSDGLSLTAADAVEALLGIEQRLADHINQLAAERDEAVKQLSESRANTGDMEARAVELEAVLRAVDDWFNDLGSQHVPNGEALARLLDRPPSVVLADHDAAVWDQGWDAAEPFIEWCQEAVDVPNPYRGDN